jgi:hypothetical protein
VARGGLFFEPGDEARELAFAEEARVGPLLDLVEDGALAGEQPQVEQRGGRRQIGLRELEGLADVDDLMPDGEPSIPERIEERVGQLRSGFAVLRAGTNDQPDVDVRTERDRAAAEGADGGEGDALVHAGRRDGRRVEHLEQAGERRRSSSAEANAVLPRGTGREPALEIFPVATHCSGGLGGRCGP